MSDDLQSKQAYLRANVLEKGYDADEFMGFLQNIKGENGLDLNNWQMNELITVVNDFIKDKKLSNPENNQNDEEKNIEENNTQDINTDSSNNFNNINSDAYDGNDNDSDMGKCLASETTLFSNIDNMHVTLSSPKKIEGKMFQKAFISYNVTTEPFNYTLNKRYSDFLWLKKVLSLIYVNCVLPPLCKKNFTDRFTDYLIEKRMRSIEKFMNGLLDHPLMKNSEIVKDFLSLTDVKEYNKKVDKYNKIKKAPTLVRQIKTLSGEVDIGIDTEKEVYFENIKNYAKGHYQLLQKITKGYKSLMNIMQQLSNKMKDISKLWKQVLEISIKNNDSHNTSETFNIMSKLMEDWSEIEKSQMKVININIREYFRYVKNEFNGLKEMSDRVQTSKNTYTKLKEKLQKTKETLFEKGDVDTWQLKEEDKQNVNSLLQNKELAFSKMLPQDTLKVEDSKNFYGCLLNSLISEFERIRSINSKRHKDNTTKFARELSSEITNLHVSLADRLSEFHELKDDKDNSKKKTGGGIKKKVEPVPEKLDDNNNNIDNKDAIEEKNKNKKEDNSNNINNKEDNKKGKNEDVAKDFVKIDHTDFIDENKKENNKENNKNKNKKKVEEKKREKNNG